MTVSLELCVQAFGACLLLKTVALRGLKGLGPLLASGPENFFFCFPRVWVIPPIRNHFFSGDRGNLCPLLQAVWLPLQSCVGNPSHLWINIPSMWLIPFGFNLLQNHLLNQDCVWLSAVIFGGKGTEFEGKHCLFIQFLLQLRQERLSWHRISRGRAVLQFVGLIWQAIFRSGSESYSESFSSGCIWV